MYDKLVKRLRLCAEGFRCRGCEYELVMGCRTKLNTEAADAIEDLEFACNRYEKDYKALCEYLPKWIPVKERLPEEMERSRGEWSAEIRPSDDVLVWLSNEKRQSVAWYSHTYNEWTTVDENTVYFFGEVTYWQPLPQPPKEE